MTDLRPIALAIMWSAVFMCLTAVVSFAAIASVARSLLTFLIVVLATFAASTIASSRE